MYIKSNIEYINELKNRAAERAGISGNDVLLLAVTKLHEPEEINEAIDCGITDIGENKVQEVLAKFDKVKPVRWHLIGHLQTNKVRQIVDKVAMIHSVDSLKLAKEIDKRSKAIDKVMDVLVQINPAMEDSKFGTSVEDAESLVEEIARECPNVKVRGLMSVAPYYEDPRDVAPYFREVKKIYDRISERNIPGVDFKYLSMGMTHDFEVAIEEGSNIIRVGTAIFGNRDYRKEEK